MLLLLFAQLAEGVVGEGALVEHRAAAGRGVVVAADQVHHAAHFIAPADAQHRAVGAGADGADAVVGEASELVVIQRPHGAPLIGDASPAGRGGCRCSLPHPSR